MSKEQKKTSERKHKVVHKILEENFPDCKVEYNGVDGIDHQITYNKKTTSIETKTCRRLIRMGVKLPTDGSPYLIPQFRFGRLKFYNAHVWPYNRSQHEDLLESNGWYTFVIGDQRRMITGCPAKDVEPLFKEKSWEVRYIPWYKLLALSYPDWMERLKKQVYE